MDKYKTIALFWGGGQKVIVFIEKIDKTIFIQRLDREREQVNKVSLELLTLKLTTDQGMYAILPKEHGGNEKIMKMYHKLKD